MTKTFLPHYSPFGSSIQELQYAYSDAGDTSKYRFGFNGKEKDSETANDNFDFGARVYDGRLGRWFSLDKLTKESPNLSAYVFTINNPICFTDPDGNKALYIIEGNTITIKALIVITGDKATTEKANQMQSQICSYFKDSKIKIGDVEYNIVFDIKVNNSLDHAASETEAYFDGYYNEILLETNLERSYVNSFGLSTGSWNDNADSKIYAHETGHLLGLDDKYYEIYTLKDPQKTNDQTYTSNCDNYIISASNYEGVAASDLMGVAASGSGTASLSDAALMSMANYAIKNTVTKKTTSGTDTNQKTAIVNKTIDTVSNETKINSGAETKPDCAKNKKH
jgi:RHS repeat-associated protein